MIKLKNVSKIYYKNGIVGTGFSKVSTEFKMGEFVVIVGESGSGKSTLLNVISGLDSYEEGEMYINGEETSHYTEEDFEEYRRKYIANIFQAFNLVNSYTVKQNVELVLLIHGYKHKEIKKRVDDILHKVDLWKYRNRRVSKLSGGQKQRVAIARALAKDTPIIVADEPTGNLDQTSANEIFKILNNIAKDKLVVVVTHNFEQVEKYATRVLRMHDGRLVEDKVLKEVNEVKTKESLHGKMKYSSKVRIALRNAFNVVPKFVLVLLVFLVASMLLLSEYAGTKKNEYQELISNAASVFQDRSAERIVINKYDKTYINENDLNIINNNSNIVKYVANDYVLDNYINVLFGKNFDSGYMIAFNVKNLNELDKDIKLEKGNMPTANNEAIVLINKDNFEYKYFSDEWFLKDGYFHNSNNGNLDYSLSFKVVGIGTNDSQIFDNGTIYLSDDAYNKALDTMASMNLEFKTEFAFKDAPALEYDLQVMVSSKVPKGEVYYPEELNNYCPNFNCEKKKISVTRKSIYEEKSINYLMSKTFTNKTVKKLTGFEPEYEGAYSYSIFMNIDDYSELINEETYQASVYVDDIKNIYDVEKYLNDHGFRTLLVKDTAIEMREYVKLFKYIRNIFIVIVLIVIYFISYLVIYLILKSRVTYFAIVRILGGTIKINKQLIRLELFIDATIGYGILMVLSYLVSKGLINNTTIAGYVGYLNIPSYIFGYVLLILMSQLIARRYSKKIFKDSMITTYNMEV